MIWKIVKKEFLLNLMTFKFAVGTILCVVLTSVFVPILAKAYQERLKTYNQNVAYNKRELRQVMVYKNITPTLFRPPSVLSVFSEGLEKQIGDSATIELDKIPEMGAAADQGNPYQAIFPVFDTLLIVKVVIGVLALLMAYDAISGERERGTLKLMLSGTTRRYELLMAKLLTGLLVLVVPVTIIFVISLIILLSFPKVDLTGSDCVRIGLMYLASLVFTSAMYNMGLLFSCITRRSSVSLVLGLFLWILFTVVVPNGSVYLAEEMQPLEPKEKIDAQIITLTQDLKSELDEIEINSPSNTIVSDERDAFGRGYMRLLNRAYLEYLQKWYRLRYPIIIKYADRFWGVKQSYFKNMQDQRRLADTLSRISPISLYERIMSTLAGTDIAVFQSFMDSVWRYRADVVGYVNSKTDKFSSSSFFTPCTQNEVDEYEKLMKQLKEVKSQAEAKRIVDANKERWEKKFAETPNLDLQDFPVFQPPDALRNIGRLVPDLGLLVFANVLFFAIAFTAFIRYDVR